VKLQFFKKSQLILNSGKTYSYEKFRAIIPPSQPTAQINQLKWYEFEKNFRLPIHEAIPLTVTLLSNKEKLSRSGNLRMGDERQQPVCHLMRLRTVSKLGSGDRFKLKSHNNWN
jgi:hypothetical protein